MKLRKAFTLIELLMTIVIIGILTTSLVSRIKSAQAQARDTKRIADIKMIQTALEMYYMEHGRYPTSIFPAPQHCGGASVPNQSWCNSTESFAGGYWIANGALAPYLPGGDPVDPKPSSVPGFSASGRGAYFYFSANGSWGGCGVGQSYVLVTQLERASSVTVMGSLCNGTQYIAGGNYIINQGH